MFESLRTGSENVLWETRWIFSANTGRMLPEHRLFLGADEPTRTADLISSYEFACVRISPYRCVRKLRLFMGFSALQARLLVHCVLACTSPVAVRLQATRSRCRTALLRMMNRAAASVEEVAVPKFVQSRRYRVLSHSGTATLAGGLSSAKC